MLFLSEVLLDDVSTPINHFGLIHKSNGNVITGQESLATL